MNQKPSRNSLRRQRQARVRKRLEGTSEKPRLVVFRSNKHMYAQVIDDLSGNTIVAANTLQKDVADKITEEMSNKDIAKLVGKTVGDKAQQKGLETVVFDRAGYKYHGNVAALADGVRESGMKL